ncbi:MAG: hypothetical protein ABIF40_05685 [archaeon]
MIDAFIKKFTDVKIPYFKIDDKYYLASKELLALAKKINLDYFTIGKYLGEENKGKFMPSLALLGVLSEISDNKIIVKDIGEMDFLYGKNLRSRHIKNCEGEQKIGFLKLVINERGDCLGYAKIVKVLDDKGVVLKNKQDMGDYLRREMSQKV